MKLICANLRGCLTGAPVRSMGEWGLSPPIQFPDFLIMCVFASSSLRCVCFITNTSRSASVRDLFVSSSSSDSVLHVSQTKWPVCGICFLQEIHGEGRVSLCLGMSSSVRSTMSFCWPGSPLRCERAGCESTSCLSGVYFASKSTFSSGGDRWGGTPKPASSGE